MVRAFPTPLPGYPPLLTVAADPSLSLAARGLYLLLWSRELDVADFRDLRGYWSATRYRDHHEALDELVRAGHVPAP